MAVLRIGSIGYGMGSQGQTVYAVRVDADCNTEAEAIELHTAMMNLLLSWGKTHRPGEELPFFLCKCGAKFEIATDYEKHAEICEAAQA